MEKIQVALVGYLKSIVSIVVDWVLMPGMMKSGYLKSFCSKAGRFSGSLWECMLLSVLVLASQKFSLASQDVVFRLPETVEAAALCSLSCGRGLGRGFAVAAENSV